MKRQKFVWNPEVLKVVVLGVCLSLGGATQAQAGVFNIQKFVEPGLFAIGLEPEVILTSGAGVGVNARYTHGITELINLHGILGMGTGPREFRIGAAMSMDFFPDIDNQPGIGLAVQSLFLTMPLNMSQMEVTGIPYIHKAFSIDGNELDPYLALPTGIIFRSNGRYDFMGQVNVGALFKPIERFRFNLETGVQYWPTTEVTISGGVIYYHQ
jgi:hypothetical protein